MASFIEGYGPQQLPPPYAFQDVRVWSFPLLARFEKVQSVVQTFLAPAATGPTDLSFDLLKGSGDDLLTLVYMMVLDYRKMACINPPECEMGYYTQKELLFGIPVIQQPQGGLPSIALFCPYIFVDNGGSMVCGNTVLGYPKQPAWFQVPQPQGGNYPIRIDAPVMARPGPGMQQTWQRLVHVRAASLLGEELAQAADGAAACVDDTVDLVEDVEEDLEKTWPFGPIERILGAGGRLPLPPNVIDLFREREEISYGILQLKQIRSAQDPKEACYRSLLSCTSKLKALHSFGLLPAATITLSPYASLDLVEALGLLSVNGRVHPLFPYRMKCDFDFVDAREQVF